MNHSTQPHLTPKEQALVGIALSIAHGCKPCTERYVRAATEAGACKRGIRLAIESALVARRRATAELTEWALLLQGEPVELDDEFLTPRALWKTLYEASGAFAQRDVKNFTELANQALSLGATPKKLLAVLAPSSAVAKAAHQHTESALVEMGIKAPSTEPSETTDCGCGCKDC
jgi:AhpD family alkylhydroperoxidase